jgi:hypothetical protein
VVATLESELGYYAGEALSGSIVGADGRLVALFPRLDLSGCDQDVSAVVLNREDFHRLQAGNWTIAIDGFAAPYGCGSGTAMRLDYEVSDGVPAAGSDLDRDGVPIELDNCPHLANADQRDCDGDGIGDRCAIAWGAEDLDGGGVPDRCQIAYGDVDLNSVVDFADVALMLLYFDEVDPPLGDMDGDRFVTTADIAVVLLNFGPVPF